MDRGLREHAFPVLRDHGFTSLCAVITDYAGRLNRWDVPLGGIRFAHLAWRDIEAWSTRGVSFVSHTATHPRLTWLADREVREELSRSRGALERALRGPCTAIAWPFGASGARERALAREEGYVAALGIGGRWRGDPFAIPCVPVYPWSGAAPGAGALAPLERALGTVASRCSVGTSVLRSFARAREG